MLKMSAIATIQTLIDNGDAKIKTTLEKEREKEDQIGETEVD
jgi:hypothetical protein